MKHADLIGRLKPEEPDKTRKPVVRLSQSMERIFDAYAAYCNHDREELFDDALKYELGAEATASKHPVSPTPADIQEFILRTPLPEKHSLFMNENLGIFISYLVNCCDADKVKIRVPSQLNCLGTYFGRGRARHFVIQGNVGDCIGSAMIKGKIEVFGNVGFSVGREMNEGIIIVHGSAYSVSYTSKGGAIYVERYVRKEEGKAKVYGKRL